MRTRLLLLVFSISACSFDPSGLGFRDAGGVSIDAPLPIDDAAVSDAMTGLDAAVNDAPTSVDAPTGAVDAPPTPDAALPPDAAPPPDAMCPGDVLGVGPSNFTSCDIPVAGAAINLTTGAWLLDTDAATLEDQLGPSALTLAANVVTQTNAPDILVVSTASFGVGIASSLTVTGDRALAIVSFAPVTIDGAVNLSASDATPGPGGSHALACATGTGGDGVTQVDDNGNTGGSGGGGGAYGGAGGNGATVDDPNPGTPTAGGMASGSVSLVPLRGGCSGGNAGNGARVGGAGGGAFQLVVDGALTVGLTGRVAAAGARGLGGGPVNGTGATGAGSGGGVLFEADSITINGAVTANGGGGGEGRRTTLDGEAGDNGHTGDANVATGGDSISSGGNGGNGGANTTAATDGVTGNQTSGTAAGGGGGGGSVGRIHFNALVPDQANGTVSPPEA